MPDFKKLIAHLQKHYGAPELPPARGAFEVVLWENACYLLPDHRRAAVFEGLRAQVGLTHDAILQAPREVLLPLAAMGGMRARDSCFPLAGNRAHHRHPVPGQPRADPRVALRASQEGAEAFPQYRRPGGGEDSPLPRRRGGTAARIERSARADADGRGRVHLKNYGAMYRSVQEDLAPQLPKGAEQFDRRQKAIVCPTLARAHLLLRAHGRSICRDSQPQCHECPVESGCAFRNPGAARIS